MERTHDHAGYRSSTPKVVVCMARPEAASQAKPGPNKPGWAGPK
jgi:hypothetical protein